ncbi:MAG: hypothetical protein AAFR61_21410 [Bacteroidota bacterium]
MKNLLISLLALTFCALAAQAQAPKVGWFIAPEVGGMFHEDHVGRVVGTSFGLTFFQNRLKVGVLGYGRSGPINPREFQVEAANGQTYRGSSTLTLRADHGIIGLLVAPTFKVGKVALDIPLVIGNMGAGFYFEGEDRNTPDGQRVSVWEDRMMDGRDAGFSILYEGGLRAFWPVKAEDIALGAGLHYSLTPGWSTYYDPEGGFYNQRLRFSLVVQFQSR